MLIINLQLTDAFEGSLIRAFRRLQELIRQMGQAAKAIGNTELEEKFAKSLAMLERPNTVVFNPSYVWCRSLRLDIKLTDCVVIAGCIFRKLVRGALMRLLSISISLPCTTSHAFDRAPYRHQERRPCMYE